MSSTDKSFCPFCSKCFHEHIDYYPDMLSICFDVHPAIRWPILCQTSALRYSLHAFHGRIDLHKQSIYNNI